MYFYMYFKEICYRK